MGHPMFMMGDTLVALDWDLKNVHPLLAKSWKVSADKLTYVFSAARRRHVLQRQEVHRGRRGLFVQQAGRSQRQVSRSTGGWATSTSIAADDPYTLVYKLKRPHAELLVDLANFAATIINKDNVEALGADFGVKGFDGTGPLCWEKWEPRKELVLKRHDAYKWGPTGVYDNKGPVKYERMIWRIVPEEDDAHRHDDGGPGRLLPLEPAAGDRDLQEGAEPRGLRADRRLRHVLLGPEEPAREPDGQARATGAGASGRSRGDQQGDLLRPGRHRALAGPSQGARFRAGDARRARPGAIPRSQEACSTRQAGRPAPTASATRTARSSSC